MGNYYEGKLIFELKRNLPDELLHDLSVLVSERSCDRDIKPLLQHRELKESKWMNHYRALYPTYTLEFSEGVWFLTASFCMKGYMCLGEDLGQDIYDFLYPYFDSSILDEVDGGYLGTIEDEDGTYRKEFYANYEQFNKIIESREYLCKDCYKKMDGSLCDDWKYCKRAYDIGRGDTIEDS